MCVHVKINFVIVKTLIGFSHHPVYKTGSVFEVGNYRPISNISSLNKIFESLTHKHLSSLYPDLILCQIFSLVLDPN